MSNDQEYIIEKVGVFTPKPTDVNELNSGLDHSNLPVQKDFHQDNNAPSNLTKSEFYSSVEKAKEYIDYYSKP